MNKIYVYDTAIGTLMVGATSQAEAVRYMNANPMGVDFSPYTPRVFSTAVDAVRYMQSLPMWDAEDALYSFDATNKINYITHFTDFNKEMP